MNEEEAKLKNKILPNKDNESWLPLIYVTPFRLCTTLPFIHVIIPTGDENE